MPFQASVELCEALRAISQLEREVIGIGRLCDPADRVRLIRTRRRLVEESGKLDTLITGDEILGRNPEARATMGRIFGEFRQALWHHYTRWPAVRIDEDRAAYAESARDTYGKGDVFWQWCATNLDVHLH